MKNMKIGLFIGAALMVASFLLTACGSVAEPTPKPEPILKIGAGVGVSPDMVREIVGSGDVFVEMSPAGYETQLAETVDANGGRHFWVPAVVPLTFASLSLSEAQEYGLRQLVASVDQKAAASSTIDMATMALSDGTLRQMANSETQRVEISPMLSTYMTVRLAEHALDSQKDLAIHALDKQAEVAKAGDAAIVGVSVADNASRSISELAILGVCVLLILSGFGIIKLGKKNQQSNGQVVRSGQRVN